jgi:NodT family efflux transporter outer membrane factor (OMF) lipoprotein
MKKFLAPILAGIPLILFSGCTTVGPEYVPPEKKVPEEFSAQLEAVKIEPSKLEEEPGSDPPIPVKKITPEMLGDWWNTLEDPLLSKLVERAIKGNLDLRLAQSRVREERARRGIAAADRFPTINASASTARQQSSQETGTGQANNLHSTGFDASWEVDLFGGIQRSVESAKASVEAREEELNDTLVTLVAEAALNFVEIRTFQARLTAAEKNLTSQEETLQIVKDRLESGLTTTLTLEQANYNFESTKSEIPTLKTGIEQGKNGLAVLLGKFPGSLKNELENYTAVPILPIEVAIGVPADLLRRRPDIRRAERELAAQTARVGVATADLYPKLTLFGSVGLESLSAASLFTGPAAAFSIGPKITWNVFDAGRVRQNITIEDEKQEQSLIQYELSILTAVKDVENAVIDYAQEQVRRKSLIKSVEASQRAVDLSRELYTAGLSDFLGVLEAERSLFQFQDQLALSEGSVVSNLIRLYKSLGGGWKPLMADTFDEAPRY